MQLPPGVQWVIANLPAFCTPLLGLYIIDRFLLCGFLEIYLPTWLTVAAYVLSLPILFTANLLLDDLKIYAKAKYLGAVFPPTVRSKLPGALDLTIAMGKAFKEAYPCKHMVYYITDHH